MAVKLLILSANPSDTCPIPIDREIGEIVRRLRASRYGNDFQIDQRPAVRATELSGHLLHEPASIVHFSGHGTPEGELLLEDETGETMPITTAFLGELFRDLQQRPRCVVLNACFSVDHARAIAEHVDVVIVMTAAIENRAAIAFSGGFYEALGYGKDVESAFKLGCMHCRLVAPGQADVPRLEMRSGVQVRSIRFVGPSPMPPWALGALLMVALFLGLFLGDWGSPSLRLFGDVTGCVIAVFVSGLAASRKFARWRVVVAPAVAWVVLLSYGVTVAFLKQPTLIPVSTGLKRRDEIADRLQGLIGGRIYGQGDEVPSRASLEELEILTSQDQIFIYFRTIRTLHDGGTVVQRDGRDIREGGWKRVYEGKVFYAGTYASTAACLKVNDLVLRDYALAPTGPFWSRLLGWFEIDSSMRNHEKIYRYPLMIAFRKLCPS